MKRRFFLGLVALPNIALAHSLKLGAIEIGHAWGLPTVGNETSVLMPLYNSGSQQDALISASTPIASSIELRDGSVKFERFLLMPNRPLPMRAVAKHLHLIGLKQPLAKGEKIGLTLNFEIAGAVVVEVHIAETAGE